MAAGGYGTVALPAPTRTRRRPRPAVPRPDIRLPRPRLPRVELPNPAALATGAVSFVAALPESSLLDRVIRGRIWIPLLGVLLVGIVGMQVENLKLNAGLGSAIQQTTTLQSRNDWLRDDVSELSDPQRIEGIAARHDMLMAPPSATKFLAPGGRGSVRAAIAGIHPPGSTYFASPAGTLSAAAAATASGSSTVPTAAG
jgi:cell division protein FtsL